MRKIGLIISGIIGCFGLIGVILFLASLPGIIGGDSDGFVYLLSLAPLIYSTMLFIKLIKNKEFDKTHKLTLHLLIWPSIIAAIISIFFAIMAMVSGEGLGLWFAIMALVFGLLISSILSLIGFIVDSVKHGN